MVESVRSRILGSLRNAYDWMKLQVTGNFYGFLRKSKKNFVKRLFIAFTISLLSIGIYHDLWKTLIWVSITLTVLIAVVRYYIGSILYIGNSKTYVRKTSLELHCRAVDILLCRLRHFFSRPACFNFSGTKLAIPDTTQIFKKVSDFNAKKVSKMVFDVQTQVATTPCDEVLFYDADLFGNTYYDIEVLLDLCNLVYRQYRIMKDIKTKSRQALLAVPELTYIHDLQHEFLYSEFNSQKKLEVEWFMDYVNHHTNSKRSTSATRILTTHEATMEILDNFINTMNTWFFFHCADSIVVHAEHESHEFTDLVTFFIYWRRYKIDNRDKKLFQRKPNYVEPQTSGELTFRACSALKLLFDVCICQRYFGNFRTDLFDYVKMSKPRLSIQAPIFLNLKVLNQQFRVLSAAHDYFVTPASIEVLPISVYIGANAKVDGVWILREGVDSTIVMAGPNATYFELLSSEHSLIQEALKYDINIFLYNYRGYNQSRGSVSHRSLRDDLLKIVKFLRGENSNEVTTSRKVIPQKLLTFYGQCLGGSLARPRHDFDVVIYDRTFSNLSRLAEGLTEMALASVAVKSSLLNYAARVNAKHLAVIVTDSEDTVVRHHASLSEAVFKQQHRKFCGEDMNLQALTGLYEFLSNSCELTTWSYLHPYKGYRLSPTEFVLDGSVQEQEFKLPYFDTNENDLVNKFIALAQLFAIGNIRQLYNKPCKVTITQGDMSSILRIFPDLRAYLVSIFRVLERCTSFNGMGVVLRTNEHKEHFLRRALGEDCLKNNFYEIYRNAVKELDKNIPADLNKTYSNRIGQITKLVNFSRNPVSLCPRQRSSKTFSLRLWISNLLSARHPNKKLQSSVCSQQMMVCLIAAHNLFDRYVFLNPAEKARIATYFTKTVVDAQIILIEHSKHYIRKVGSKLLVTTQTWNTNRTDAESISSKRQLAFILNLIQHIGNLFLLVRRHAEHWKAYRKEINRQSVKHVAQPSHGLTEQNSFFLSCLWTQTGHTAMMNSDTAKTLLQLIKSVRT